MRGIRPLLLCLCFLLARANKYNQKLFIDVPVISFVDPVKHGFRVILAETFLKSQLGPHLLPTLYVRAVPLKQQDPNFSAILYPDQFSSDKHISITGLRERSWYYVCLEWENFNRHNETTGTSCRLYRTLDRFGKAAETTLSDCQMTGYTEASLAFRVRSDADFPIRLSAHLTGTAGQSPTPALTYILDKPTDLRLLFPFLTPETNYGQLCFTEEPLVSGYTTLGRLIPRITIQNCCMSNLKTEISGQPFDAKMSKDGDQVLAYMQTMDKSAIRGGLSVVLFVFALFIKIW